MPFIVVTQYGDLVTSVQKFFACLLSPTAFGLGCHYVSFWEQQGEGLQWSNVQRGSGDCDSFSFTVVCMCMVLDTVLYMLVAAWVDTVFPGEFGVPKPPLFFLSKSFWCRASNSARSVSLLPCVLGVSVSHGFPSPSSSLTCLSWLAAAAARSTTMNEGW
jgi:hypothetical protein